MGECLLGANGLDNDNDFPYENHHGRSVVESPDEIPPPKSIRADAVEKMCKWFGPIPSDNDKDINTTSHFLRNRNASASWIEEERYCGSNNKLAENRKQSRLASWRASNWERTTPTSEQWRYESSLMINTTRVTEPPTLMDEDEVDDSSKEIDTNLTTIWYTPLNKSSRNGGGGLNPTIHLSRWDILLQHPVFRRWGVRYIRAKTMSTMKRTMLQATRTLHMKLKHGC